MRFIVFFIFCCLYPSISLAEHYELGSLSGFKRVLFIPAEIPNQFEVNVVLHFGEYDLSGREGLAHYLEHLVYLSVFDGGLPSESSQGGHSNAATSGRYTSYHFGGKTSEYQEILRNVYKVFQPIRIDGDYANSERNIVAHEYELRVGNDERVLEYSQLLGELFQHQGFGRSVIGYPAEIAQYTLEQAEAIHQSFYKACNASLVVIGDMNPAEFWSAFHPDGLEHNRETMTCPQQVQRTHSIPARSVRKQITPETAINSFWYTKFLKLGDDETFPKRVAQTMLARRILDSTLEGSLGRALRFDQFLASEFGLEFSMVSNQDLNLWFSARPDVGVSIDQLEAGFKNYMIELSKNGVPRETFDQVKQNSITKIKEKRRSARTEYANVFNWLSRDHDPITDAEFIQVIESVEYADIQKLFIEVSTGHGAEATLISISN